MAVVDGTLLLALHPRRKRSRCPNCGGRVLLHSYYQRRLRDLPSFGHSVVAQLRVRRLRCCSGPCGRKIFTEQIPAVAKKWARETVRASRMLRRFGYELGGRPSSGLLGAVGGGDIRLLIDRSLCPSAATGRRCGALLDRGAVQRPHRRADQSAQDHQAANVRPALVSSSCRHESWASTTARSRRRGPTRVREIPEIA